MLTIVRKIPMKKYFTALRNAPLENVPSGEKIFVYKHARLELRKVWPEEINPSTFYLLKDSLEAQYALREFLLKNHGIDTLNLSACVEFIPDGQEKSMLLIPPVVEFAEELVVFPQRLDSVPCPQAQRLAMPEFIDGQHRAFMAMQEGLQIRVIYISQASSWDHPLYAYPNSWDDVRLYDRIEDVPRKKLYRRDPRNTFLRPLRVLGNTGAVGRGDAKPV